MAGYCRSDGKSSFRPTHWTLRACGAIFRSICMGSVRTRRNEIWRRWSPRRNAHRQRGQRQKSRSRRSSAHRQGHILNLLPPRLPLLPLHLLRLGILSSPSRSSRPLPSLPVRRNLQRKLPRATRMPLRLPRRHMRTNQLVPLNAGLIRRLTHLRCRCTTALPRATRITSPGRSIGLMRSMTRGDAHYRMTTIAGTLCSVRAGKSIWAGFHGTAYLLRRLVRGRGLFRLRTSCRLPTGQVTRTG